jgi:lipopolysaccharide assembly outer membrane protein LptD (OstA)
LIYKGKNTIILGLFIVLSINSLFAQEFPTKKPFKIPAKTEQNSEKTKKASNSKKVKATEITIKSQDTVKKSINKTITDIIPHSAEDYIKMDRKANKMYLYNKAKITYGDIDIEAGLIIIDFKNNEIYATGIKDSLGNLTQRPVFVQAGSSSTHDEMRVNYKTKKALLHNSVSEMDGNKELKYFLAHSKKENDSVIFAKDAKITTSEDIYNPEYYIHIHKMKLIPNKKIIAGYSHLVIENVPTPLGIPFAFFPITDTQTSGILMPVWGENKYGYFLQNGGYYFAISDYIDLALQGSIYMNGSYGFKMSSNYKKRYRYGGSFGFDYSTMITSERGLPNYAKNKLYRIRWNHSPDRKSSPNASFSASVNYTSSKFYRDNVDVNYNDRQQNNTSTSSITYTKAFVGTPFNLTASTNISQNFNTESVNLTLPSVRVSMQQIFPLAKLVKGKNILSNLSLNYDFNSQNNITTDEAHFFKDGMMDKAKSAIVHTSGLSTNLTALKYLRFTLGGQYKEVWNFQTVHKSWDNTVSEVKKDTIKGFDAFRTYSFNASMNTTLYGLFRFKEGKRLQAIRHAVTPSITFSTAPKFEQYYDDYQASIDPTDIARYTRFEYVGSGRPSLNESRILSFSVSNEFEAKINKKDSLHPDAKPEKRMLLRNLNFSTSYDMVKDTLKWSPLSVSTTIPLMKSKMNIILRSSYSFYAKDASGRDVNVFNKEAGGSLLRFKSLSATTSYSFSSSKKGTKQQKKTTPNKNSNTNIDSETYYSFKIPWTCNLSYTFNMNDTGITRNIISFSGSVDVTPKWHIGYQSGYDIKDKGFSFTSFNINRDLDSWTMNFNWTPKGYRNTWGFFIGIKSSVLSDIKWDKQGP